MLPPETAHALAQRGDILPLAEVLRRAGFEGEILGVVLHRQDGRYLYKIKAIGLDGQYRELEADAQNGKLSGQ